ncbi:MAG: type I methionyl aminopeptidase [Candidatus Latescibacteria bacterium]|nr:type I methionyl aminopeptidase [Candidatus Latescibacterota bacterium]
MIILKTPREIELLRESNRIVADVLATLRSLIQPGITTKELDQIAEDLILKKGAVPAFKGYMGYPAALCTSVNEEVIHGVPGPRQLKPGDIVSLDLGVKLGGYYGDATITVPVGEVSKEAERLLRVTEMALYEGIKMARVGNRLYDISYAIQSLVESNGFSVVRDFVGHGVGKNLHEEPKIPNFGRPGHGPRLKEGMVLALEPMVNQGGWQVRILPDGWTVVTADGKLSAHFEHTIAVTDTDPEILSLPSSSGEGQKILRR